VNTLPFRREYRKGLHKGKNEGRSQGPKTGKSRGQGTAGTQKKLNGFSVPAQKRNRKKNPTNGAHLFEGVNHWGKKPHSNGVEMSKKKVIGLVQKGGNI